MPLRSGREVAERSARESHIFFASGVDAVDRLLGGGFERRKLTELTGRRSSGRFAIVHSLLAATTSLGEAAALVDLGDGLEPRSLTAAGADLSRLLWVRPESLRDAVTSAELLLSTGFPVVVLDLGIRLRGRRVADAAWLRLARAALAHDSAMVISSPFPISGTAAGAAIALRNASPRWNGSRDATRILQAMSAEAVVERHRRTRVGSSEKVELRG
jgi:hypothetical protein